MMSNSNLFKIQSLLREEGIHISFSGRFTQSIIEELGEALKNYLEAEQRPKNNIFNIFSIFIEQTQNIRNYNVSKENSQSYDKIAQSCIVTIGSLAETNYIFSGNLIETNDARPLTDSLEHINTLNKDELKALFKEKRKAAINLETGSAGLGLIDIARKASAPLDYSITKIDDAFSYFTLKVLV